MKVNYLSPTSSASCITAILAWHTDPGSSMPTVFPQAGSEKADNKLVDYLHQVFSGGK